MNTNIEIYGSIIDNEMQREDVNDMTVGIFRDSVQDVKEGDTLTLHINSCGGSVPTGIAISNTIKQMKSKGITTVAVVDGVAASIASVIACACDKIEMFPSSFMMIHNPWVMTSGDAETLRKEANTLDAMKNAILSFYLSKFSLPKEELIKMMDEETWISGDDAKTFGLDVIMLTEEKEFKIAASMKKSLTRFNNKEIIKKIMNEEVKVEEETKEVAEVTEEVKVEEATEVADVNEETKEEIKEEIKEEVKVDVDAIIKENEELKLKIAELESQLANKEEEVVTVDECEKRVSGMQSTMAKKMDTIKNDFSIKMNEFTNQLKVKDEELVSFKNEVINLKTALESTKSELSKMTSAFEEKDEALKMLNFNVNVKSHVNRDIKIRKF